MSLRRIALRDFVIVEALELDLHAGFTALTGETGAGKSILIDALQLLLGARADAGVVREGAERTELCAEFDVQGAALGAWLAQGGYADEQTLLLRRSIDLQGRSRAWINGSAATAGELRALGELLVDIHGQHAWQGLTRPDTVRGLLDAYAGSPVQPLAALWAAWREAHRALESTRAAQDGVQQERERLQWQIDEVSRLAPLTGEWEELNLRHARLSNAQALIDGAGSALASLEHEEGGGALALLARARHHLGTQSALEPEFAALTQELDSCIAEAEDVARSLHGYLRHADPDPSGLAQLDARLSQWLQLARRYKRAPEELPALLEGWRSALEHLDSAADLERLQAAERTQRSAYDKAARALSLARARAAPRLARAITDAMQGLGMEGGHFSVELTPAPEPGPHGIDQVAFLVASHPAMTPRPVGKVASGGELSRIALAISVCTSELGEAPTLIFDEVDAGVGGAVGHQVGRLMRTLGRARQVLAVTHLPQVAACADQHLVVSKHKAASGTTSAVAAAQADARVAEIARMLGGSPRSATTLAHAREMLGAGSTETEGA